MPHTVKEIVQFKLKTLGGKVHFAQQCVDKLYESLEFKPMDFNCVNVALDNMLLSFDEFVTHFDEVCPGLNERVQTHKSVSRGATSHIPSSRGASSHTVSSKDTGNEDVVSRMNQLEEAMDEMRSTIHGGGDGEGSPHRGILSHLSVLENSFNEGTQKLISMEEKVQDIDVRQAKFLDETRNKTVKEGQRKEIETIAVTNQFKNFEEKFQRMIIENDAQKQRLNCVEDSLKIVKAVNVTSGDQAKELESIAVERFQKLENKVKESVSDTDACKKKLTSMEEELNAMKVEIESKEDSEKESENNQSVNGRIDKLEERFETTESDTDSCKDRLTCVEEQLKSVEPVSDGDRDEEMKGLKLQVTNLDSLTKTQVLQRLTVLENQPNVAFKAWLKHNGPWKNGTVIQCVENVLFNVGNAFEKDQCRFLLPVDGIYCFALYLLLAKDCNEIKVKLELCDADSNEVKDVVCVVTAQRQVNGGSNCDLSLINAKKGQAIRATVHSEGAFECCIVDGWLVSTTG